MICRNVATEGAVLLKNENKVLPFKSGSTVAGFGRNFYYSFKGGKRKLFQNSSGFELLRRNGFKLCGKI